MCMKIWSILKWTLFQDSWDGYRANRARVLDHLYGNEITNTIILAGDSHANWVSDLARQFICDFLWTIDYCLGSPSHRPKRYIVRLHSLQFYSGAKRFRYNPATGEGAIGVEFAGTAVTSTSSFGAGITPALADVKSRSLLAANADLQWSEGSYRGFFVLTIDSETLNATYYGMRNTCTSAHS